MYICYIESDVTDVTINDFNNLEVVTEDVTKMPRLLQMPIIIAF